MSRQLSTISEGSVGKNMPMGEARAVAEIPQKIGGNAGLSFVQVWAGLLALAGAAATLMQILPGSASRHGCFALALAFLVCLLAAWFDAASDRIPNELTYPAVLAGIVLSVAGSLGAALHWNVQWIGSPGISNALLGLALCMGIGLAAMIFASMGGGDMKVLAALGALLGLHDVAPVLLWALAAALPYALLNLAFRGRLNAALRAASMQMLILVFLHQPAGMRQPGEEPLISKSTVPLAVPILAGLILCRLFPGVML